MNTIGQDVRHALRLMRRSPGITVLAILAVAIGIGATSTLFSVVYGVLLRPMPYPGSDRLVAIFERQRLGDLTVAYPDYEDMRGQVRSFESFTAGARTSFNLTGQGEPERIQGRLVSADWFRTFGVQIPVGRDFRQDDDREGAAPVAILMYGFWQRHFGGSADVIGRTVTLNDRQYTVIGVAPPGFRYGEGIDLFTPLEPAKKVTWGRGAHFGLLMIGRLKPGVSIQQAQAEMDQLYHAVEAAHPNDGMPGRLAHVRPILDIFIEDVQRPLWIMFAAVGFMLLIACSNVATLLLARATARERELAIRNAMGASRKRILRQLLTESVLLSVAGGLLGLIMAQWGIVLLRAAKPVNLPRIDGISLHPWVLAFTAGVSILTGLLFGIVPALHASKTSVNDLLKDTAGRGSTVRSGRSRDALVVTEFALALILLVGAGLTIKSLVRLMSVNLGFVPQNLLTFQLSLPPQKYDVQAGLNMLDRFRDSVASIPGVEDAAYINSAPLVTTLTQSFYRSQDDMRDLNNEHDAVMYMTSPPYPETMKITLLRGRFLTDSDRANTAKVAVVDENLAKQIFPGEDPIGKRIKYGANANPFLMEIVGVVAHIRHTGLDEADPVKMQFYVPISQCPPEYLGDVLRGMSFVVRSTGSPESVSQSVRAKLAQIDSSLPLYEVKTYDQLVKDHSEVQRFTASILAAFAGIALFLAAIGIYGVLSYAVAQRVREIGIRIALGAAGSDMLRMVLRQAMARVAVGITIGTLAALALTRFMNSVLFGVKAWDPMVFGGIAVLLVSVALLASYLPARRATKVDPMVALRYE